MLYLKIFALILCAFGVHKIMGGIAWIPFVLFAIFLIIRDFSTRNNLNHPQEIEENVTLGVIGEYIVDAEKVYGLYLVLRGARIFVDIKRDALLLEREKVALELFEKQSILEIELRKFILKYDQFSADQINSFGVHSEDLSRVEVFWESGEYTILNKMVFCID